MESERDSAVRQNKTLDLDLWEMHDQMAQITPAKTKVENKYFEVAKENSPLSSIIQENEEELENIMKKYKSTLAAVSSQQVILQNQSCAIIDLEKEKIKLVEEVGELCMTNEILENENLNSSKIHRLEIKTKILNKNWK